MSRAEADSILYGEGRYKEAVPNSPGPILSEAEILDELRRLAAGDDCPERRDWLGPGAMPDVERRDRLLELDRRGYAQEAVPSCAGCSSRTSFETPTGARAI